MINFPFDLVQVNCSEPLWQTLIQIIGLGQVGKSFDRKSLPKDHEHIIETFNRKKIKPTPEVTQQITEALRREKFA
jgi:hypothetical protein